MEIPVEAEDDGTVKEIRCEEGQAVNEGDVLVVLERRRRERAARGRQADPRLARRGGRPHPHLQPRAPQRARPRDPRRPGGNAAAARPGARDSLRGDHRRAARLLGRLRHRLDPVRDLRARRRGARRPPLPRARWRRSPRTPGRRSPRSTVTAWAAGWSWRSPATCASAPRGRSWECRRPSSASSTATPGCASSSTRSALARTKELFLTGRNVGGGARRADRPGARGGRRRGAGAGRGRAGRGGRRQRAALDEGQQARDRPAHRAPDADRPAGERA